MFQWAPTYAELVALNALDEHDVFELREDTIPDQPNISIVVPIGVSGVQAFRPDPGEIWHRPYLRRVKQIKLPETVFLINNRAFERVTNLETIAIPNSVVRIGRRAFFGCGALRSVTFAADSKLQHIDEEAFCLCKQLSVFHCPPSVLTIGEDIFSSCHNLHTVTLSNLIVEIPESCFNESGLETLGHTPLTITIPAGIRLIGKRAFRLCTSATKLFVTNGPRNLVLGHEAIYACRALKSAILHRVTHIEKNAFAACSDMRIVCMSERLVSCSWDLKTYCHILILAVAGPVRKIGGLLDVWTVPAYREQPYEGPRIPVLHTPDWDIQWGNERQIGNDQAKKINAIPEEWTPLAHISNVTQTARRPSVVSVDGRIDDPNDQRFNHLYNLAMLPDKTDARRALVLFAGYNRAISKDPDLPKLLGFYDMALNVSLKHFRWRWRLPLELKIMIVDVPQVDWMPTLRAFNLV
jgi:hypothetical protein